MRITHPIFARSGFCLLLPFYLVVSSSLFGFQEAKVEKATDSGKPEMVTAQSKPIRVFEILDGALQSSNSSEIKTNIKAWTELSIKEVVEDGTAVKSGDVVMKLDTEKIDEAIAEADSALNSAKLDHEDAKLSAEQARIEFKLNNALNEREMKNAKDDYEYYRDVERSERQKDLDWSTKFSEYSLEYAEEELDQLMKMYSEDELIEESEKIVLKRAQRSVDSARHRKEQNRLRTERQEMTVFPREDVRREDELKRKELAYEKTRATLPFASDRAEINLKKAELALEKASKKVADLRADQKNMTLTAPADGILYHGRFVAGKWVGVSGATSRKLEPDKKVPPREVVMTVVDPASLAIRAEIPEDKLGYFANDSTGTAVMKFDRSIRMPVRLRELLRVPLANGNFEGLFDIRDFDNRETKVLPAMTCQLSFKIHEQADAITVPKASVFSDDGINHYVYISKDERKDVVVGQTSGDDIEITSGLAVGDKILKSKP